MVFVSNGAVYINSGKQGQIITNSNFTTLMLRNEWQELYLKSIKNRSFGLSVSTAVTTTSCWKILNSPFLYYVHNSSSQFQSLFVTSCLTGLSMHRDHTYIQWRVTVMLKNIAWHVSHIYQWQRAINTYGSTHAWSMRLDTTKERKKTRKKQNKIYKQNQNSKCWRLGLFYNYHLRSLNPSIEMRLPRSEAEFPILAWGAAHHPER